jgi:hypothetical protein
MEFSSSSTCFFLPNQSTEFDKVLFGLEDYGKIWSQSFSFRWPVILFYMKLWLYI